MRMFRSVRVLSLALLMMAAPLASFGGVFLSVSFGPPPLPVYEQPLCPGDGYIWTPGYWAYGDEGYFWVPGTWVMAPRVGFLWTPGYWGWGGGAFIFHEGYWGPHIGFYGGINYGYGYGGHGYEGGYWDHDHFSYNRSVNNINVTNVHNVYNKTVINNVTVNRVSYNGGQGGLNERPRTEELAAQRESHVQATQVQMQHMQAASTNRAQFASVNHGQPAIAATPRPGAFNERGVVAARPASSYQANNRNGGYNGNGSRPLITAHQPQNGANRPAYQPGNAPANRGYNNSYNGGYNNGNNVNRQVAPAHQNANPGQYNQRTQPQYAPRQNSQPQYVPRQNNNQPQYAPQQHNNAPRNSPAPRTENAPRQEEHRDEPHGRR
ncbi:MAG TPA: hypothetical protein VGD59_12970 [Acidisarcina sp.]